MGRWLPDAAGRLQQAAMQLFLEKGYEATTVAQIAERAGLTERTFFRYFPDKREVLFSGSDLLIETMRDALAAAPAEASTREQVAAALGAAASVLTHREHARLRQSLLDDHAELMERELIKMARLSGVLAEALRARGAPELTARVAAESGVAVFRVAFLRWVSSDRGTLQKHIDDVLAAQARVWTSTA